MNKPKLESKRETSTRPSSEIRRQLADLAEVMGKAEEYGARDHASTSGLKSLRKHKAQLDAELKASELLESDIDLVLPLDGDVMVQREMEKPGFGDKVVCTLDQNTKIYRFRTNPEGKDRAASCRPPSVLVPGSALRSCRHGALSSAQATSHRSAAGRFEQ